MTKLAEHRACGAVQGSRWIKRGALLGALAVALGAFGAHGLGSYLVKKYAGETREVLGESVSAAGKSLADFKTAASYQLSHALVIVATGTLMTMRPRRGLTIAAWCFLLGTLIFSGSLYALVLSGVRWLGAITPIGGILLIIGWLALVEGACLGGKPVTTHE